MTRNTENVIKEDYHFQNFLLYLASRPLWRSFFAFLMLQLITDPSQWNPATSMYVHTWQSKLCKLWVLKRYCKWPIFVLTKGIPLLMLLCKLGHFDNVWTRLSKTDLHAGYRYGVLFQSVYCLFVLSEYCFILALQVQVISVWHVAMAGMRITWWIGLRR